MNKKAALDPTNPLAERKKVIALTKVERLEEACRDEAADIDSTFRLLKRAQDLQHRTLMQSFNLGGGSGDAGNTVGRQAKPLAEYEPSAKHVKHRNGHPEEEEEEREGKEERPLHGMELLLMAAEVIGHRVESVAQVSKVTVPCGLGFLVEGFQVYRLNRGWLLYYGEIAYGMERYMYDLLCWLKCQGRRSVFPRRYVPFQPCK